MLGVMVAWQPWAALAAAVAWLLVYLISRYVSLASIVAGVVPTLLLMLTGHNSLDVLVAATLTMLLVARHRANIERLIRGEEPKTR